MSFFQVFCSHLKQLIQQLYAVSEKMELLGVPTVDIDSVMSSLAEYQVGTLQHSRNNCDGIENIWKLIILLK